MSPRHVVSCACFVENMLETFQIYKKTSAPTFVFCRGFFEAVKVTAVLTSHVGEPKNNGFVIESVEWLQKVS